MAASEKRRSRRKHAYAAAGVYAMLFMLASVFFLWAALAIPIIDKGFTLSIGGGLGIMTLILSLCGIQCARRGLREPDKKHANCIIGLIGCVLTFAISLAIYLGGL